MRAEAVESCEEALCPRHIPVRDHYVSRTSNSRVSAHDLDRFRFQLHVILSCYCNHSDGAIFPTVVFGVVFIYNPQCSCCCFDSKCRMYIPDIVAVNYGTY